MDNKIRLSGIIYESLVNGPGIRRVLFAQGCFHDCKGCFNPETHDPDGGELFDIDDLVYDINRNVLLHGVTFSGGDPWEQADKFAYIAEKVKKPGFNIWSYTGYTYEFILDNRDKRKGWRDLLNNIDVLVDGKFEQELYDPALKFRGSSNQRIIDVRESLKKGEIVILDFKS